MRPGYDGAYPGSTVDGGPDGVDGSDCAAIKTGLEEAGDECDVPRAQRCEEVNRAGGGSFSAYKKGGGVTVFWLLVVLRITLSVFCRKKRKKTLLRGVFSGWEQKDRTSVRCIQQQLTT